MEEDIFQKINPEIYYELRKDSWFRKAFPTIDTFDCRNYESGKKYFEYHKLKHLFNEEYIIFETNLYATIYRLLWIFFWLYSIYNAYQWSFNAAYALSMLVIGGYIGIIAKGEWEKKSLRIDSEGCELDQTIFLSWNDITAFITIPYFMDKANNQVVYAYIITKSGVLYKFDFATFTFSSKEIKRKYLPVYVEYFREKSLNLT